MAFYTSSGINSITDLRDFIRTSCVASGWTLSGNVLHKGSTYVDIVDDGTIGLRIKGGNGIDGSNLLTDAGPYYCYLGTIAGIPLAYPMTVDIHVNTSPDEVYVVCNFSSSYYLLMAWGRSDVPGLTGTGNWYHAARFNLTGSNEFATAAGGYLTFINFGGHADGSGLFMVYAGTNGSSASGGATNSFIHHDIDGHGWGGTNGQSNFASSNPFISPLLAIQPNTWNGEMILLPFPVYKARDTGSKYSLVADLRNIRHCRIDNYEPGDIVTLGTDTWKVYPWFRKDSTAPDGGDGITHSGTLGYAVRYTP